MTGGSGYQTVFSDHDTDVYLGIDSSNKPFTSVYVGANRNLLFALPHVLSAAWVKEVPNDEPKRGVPGKKPE
jgi:hypothetical protein